MKLKFFKTSLVAVSLFSSSLFADSMFYNKDNVENLKVFSSKNTAIRFNQTIQFIGDQLSQNKDITNIKDSLIAITSFVDLSNFDKTNMLGNLIAESLIHEMQIRGFGVVAFKMMKSIKIKKDGDFMLSRKVRNLKKDFQVNYSLTGTYTKIGSGVLINARIINIETNRVVSTAQSFLNTRDYRSIVFGGSDDATYGRIASPQNSRQTVKIEQKF